MIYWIYAKYSIYIFCVIIFVILLYVLQDFLATEIVLDKYLCSEQIKTLLMYGELSQNIAQKSSTKFENSEFLLNILNNNPNTNIGFSKDNRYLIIVYKFGSSTYKIKRKVPNIYKNFGTVYIKISG